MFNLLGYSSRKIVVLIFSSLFISSIAQSNYKKDSLKLTKSNYMTNEKMRVEIWSDIMCPFCYIGKRQFEEALKEFSSFGKIEVVWRSFLLDPSLPKPSSKLSTYEYLAKRKGISLEQSISLHRNVSDMAKGVGLNYNFDIAVVANSFDAHRLIQLAKTFGLGDKAEERLFKAYFSEGKDMCDVNLLIALGKEIGISEVDLNQLLISDSFADEVKSDIEDAKRIGVTGVPFFVFNRQYAVSGAQGSDVFKDILQKAFTSWEKAETQLKDAKVSGKVCTPENGCE
ncbi:MAG: DsbA family oxidoreductase [Bacteroidota bacterium]|jgi:predicted DsbA family dithiol-disulfide isomerase